MKFRSIKDRTSKDRSTAKNSSLGTVIWLDLRETLRARWFQLFIFGFATLLAVFFALGLAESQILGFTGLGRTLLTFIQLCMVILPGFVLIATARSLVADREAGVLEYILSLPLSFRSYFWGKFCSRLLAFALPLIAMLMAAGIFQGLRGAQVNWPVIFYFVGLVTALVTFFLGASMLISVMARSQEMAIGYSFALWLMSEALVDTLLLGILIKGLLPPVAILAISLLNPLQAFRIASFSLFDPELTALGPLALTIVDEMGLSTLYSWSLLWPVAMGVILAATASYIFNRKDVI